MPTATTVLPHVKITWGGSLGTPAAEVWANGVAWVPTGNDMSGVTDGGLAREQANIGGLSAAIQDWFQTPLNTGAGPTSKGAGIGVDAKLLWVKLNAVGADGKYLFAPNTFYYPAAIPGGGCSVNGVAPYRPPWQMSTAITLRTTIARGRGSKGRVFPPLSGSGPQPGLSYQNVDVATIMCNSFTGLLDNINSGMYRSTAGSSLNGYEQTAAFNSLAGNCVIASTSPTSGPHAGAPALLTPILRVEVDRTADVQTRRVNRVARAISADQTVTLNL